MNISTLLAPAMLSRKRYQTGDLPAQALHEALRMEALHEALYIEALYDGFVYNGSAYNGSTMETLYKSFVQSFVQSFV